MGNIKSKIIPEDLKLNIDEIMEKELFNANRYYAESNFNISNLMNKELSYSPTVFYTRLVNRWNWHNSFYELLLEPAYSSIIKNTDTELSPKDIDVLIKVYFTLCLVDEATLVMSGAIKKYLDSKCNQIFIQDENSTVTETSQMLITPPLETFFAQYQIDHLYYIYLLKTRAKELFKFKEYLKKKYHADDEKIFNSRFEKKFNKKLNMPEKEILNEIKKYKIPEYYKNKHFYFTMEHHDRKAIRDIIIFDNVNEKFLASNLIGISGFLLRKKILEYLNASKVLTNSGYIYEHNNETIIKSLEILREKKVNEMTKDVKPYKQRGDTCAIACMMMVLEYNKIMKKANWYDEKRFHRIYGSKYIIGTPFSALAYHMSKNRLDTTIYHSEEKIFNNSKKAIEENTYNSAMEEYKEYLEYAEKKGTKVINGIDFNSTLLKEKMEEGNITILAGELAGKYHAVLIIGYEKDKFIVCDPLYKDKQTWSEEKLENFMNTSIGKWFITIGGRTKEKDKLLENLDKFNADSKNILSTNENKDMTYGKR